MVGWEGTGDEPTQADARLCVVITGKEGNHRFRWYTCRNVRVRGVAIVASQTCLQGRVGDAYIQVVNLQGC